ncbi:MAG: hypothetical protein H6907_03760 [Hyphomicrobiales bacterium]|nr:hypothetical protein [Hyphomicrobiales bacterium]
MGWLLTIWLSIPLVQSDMEVRMWFSRERYCTFAREKFLENPMLLSTPDGRRGEARVRDSQCRELGADETALIPEHMRN